MNINTEAVMFVAGILSMVGGFLAWWFGKVLAERKEDLTQNITMKYLAEDIRKMQEDIKEMKAKCERIPIIEEQLKHFK